MLILPVIVALLTAMPVTVPLIKPVLLNEPAVPSTTTACGTGELAIVPVFVTTKEAPPVKVHAIG